MAPDLTNFGALCESDLDCVDATCLDGVCCRVATCPMCQACGRTGRCENVPAGNRDPLFWCEFRKELPSSCGKSATCDGEGGCAYYPQGTICDPGTCNGGVVVNAHTCDGRGQCVPGATIVCAPFACDSGLCNQSCTSDTDCLSGSCVSGSCGKRSNGGRCENDHECASGFCADGVCCNEACTAPCTSCSQRGREGSCAYVAMGEFEPRNRCSVDPPTTCGFDGTCNGTGGCLRHRRGVVCGRACTKGGVSLRTDLCDGAGTCRRNAEIALCPTNTCDGDKATCQ